MTDPSRNLDVQQSLCESFAELLDSDEDSSIEKFLYEASVAQSLNSDQQNDLLRSLVQMDAMRKSQVGKPADLDDYASRFPQLQRNQLAKILRASKPKTPGLPGRFQPIEEIGRGGIGVVWRVIDRRMDRPLAAKMLLPRHQHRLDANERMRRESLVTGSLQHPGIPPIHEFGTTDSGAVFFTMKLVEGETLAHLLKQRENASDELPRMLGIFEQLAQTVAYAHGQNVIHRDLKPQNVMVGEFGEVQVMDWGMAKRLDVDNVPSDVALGPDAPTAIVSDDDTANRSLDSSLAEQDLTRPGEVFGTPAYMAPEQAQGETDSLVPASDVFGLGAILFEILTASRLYPGSTGNEALVRAASCDLDEARQLLKYSNAPTNLVELCQSCLEVQPGDRPQDAAQVALAITQYFETTQDQLRQAELDRRAAEVRATEEQKRRKTTITLASLIATAILVGLLGVAWQWKQATVARADAEQKTRLADERFLQAKQTVDEYLTQVANSKEYLGSTPGTQRLRRTLLEKARSYYLGFVERVPDDPVLLDESAAAHLALAEITSELESGNQPIEYLEDCIQTCEELIRNGQEQDHTRYRILVATSLIAKRYNYLGELEQSMDWAQQTIDASADYLTLNPDDRSAELLHANAFHALALSQNEIGNRQNADSNFRKSLELKEELISKDPQDGRVQLDLAATLSQLGSIELNRNNVDLAEQAFQRCRRLCDTVQSRGQTELAANVSNTADINLATILKRQGKTKEGIELLRKALKPLVELSRQNPNVLSHQERLALTYNNLAELLRTIGDTESLKIVEQSMELVEKNLSEHPDSYAFMAKRAIAFSTRSMRLMDVGKTEEALRVRQASLAQHQRLRKLSPSNLLMLENTISDLIAVGMLQRRIGEIDSAINSYQTAIDTLEQTKARGIETNNLLMFEAQVLNNLGYLYDVERRPDEAITPLKKAAKIYNDLAGDDPLHKAFVLHASTLCNIGGNMISQKKGKEALPWLEKSIELLKVAREARPDNLPIKQFLQQAYMSTADATIPIKDYETADEALAAAIAIHHDGRMNAALELKRGLVGVYLKRDIPDHVAKAIEIGNKGNSDILALASYVVGQAANEASENPVLDDATKERLVSQYAEQANALLVKAAQRNSFLMYRSRLDKFFDHSALSLVSKRPEFAKAREMLKELTKP